jgi:hypothetical protein
MSGHPDKIAEHYRELAAEEVALARAAVTNGVSSTRADVFRCGIIPRERLDQGGCARWPMGVCIRLLTRPRTHSVSRAASYVLLIEPAP